MSYNSFPVPSNIKQMGGYAKIDERLAKLERGRNKKTTRKASTKKKEG